MYFIKSSIVFMIIINTINYYFLKRIKPVGKASGPGKNRGYAVCAGFPTLLMHPVMTCHRPMGCFRFYGLPIRTHLNHIFRKFEISIRYTHNMFDYH
ncbi:hypothetical protein Hanom_Chr12g01091481 [Helianthus anomalus]